MRRNRRCERTKPVTHRPFGPISPPGGRRGWPVPHDATRPVAAGSVPAPRSVPVTAIILAREEAPNIVRAIVSVGWCEQVVVDSGSTDGTVELARRRTRPPGRTVAREGTCARPAGPAGATTGPVGL